MCILFQPREKREQEKPACDTICPQGPAGFNGTDVIDIVLVWKIRILRINAIYSMYRDWTDFQDPEESVVLRGLQDSQVLVVKLGKGDCLGNQ
jgi:hypothetical protein